MKLFINLKCFDISEAVQQGINEYHRQAGYSVNDKALKTKTSIRPKNHIKLIFVFLTKFVTQIK